MQLRTNEREKLVEPLRVSALLDMSAEDRQKAILDIAAKAAADDAQRHGPRQAEPEPSRRCWALRPDEPGVCSGGAHSRDDGGPGGTSDRCIAYAVRQAQLGLGRMLVECGVPQSYVGPISPILAECYGTDRQYRVSRWDTDEDVPLSKMVLLMLGEVFSTLTKRNVLLHGPKGCGKSHLQALLYFLAIETGLDVAWIDTLGMRELVSDLGSKRDEVRDAALGKWRLLARRRVIFFSDLGLNDAPPRSSNSQHVLLADSMWKLCEESRATLCMSSNLPPYLSPEQAEEDRRYGRRDWNDRKPRALVEHPDVGSRVLSRIIGSRIDERALEAVVAKAQTEGRVPSLAERDSCSYPAVILKFSSSSETAGDQRLRAGTLARRAQRGGG